MFKVYFLFFKSLSSSSFIKSESDKSNDCSSCCYLRAEIPFSMHSQQFMRLRALCLKKVPNSVYLFTIFKTCSFSIYDIKAGCFFIFKYFFYQPIQYSYFDGTSKSTLASPKKLPSLNALRFILYFVLMTSTQVRTLKAIIYIASNFSPTVQILSP